MYDSQKQTRVPARSTTPSHVDRRFILARAHRIAMDYAGGYREGLTRSTALAELADLAAGPNLLAQAAAMHAVASDWYAINAVDLLLEAGAPARLVDHYVDGAEALDGPAEAAQFPERRAG